jgi:hypothetical protein
MSGDAPTAPDVGSSEEKQLPAAGALIFRCPDVPITRDHPISL